mmetsp:Transcript_22994/g.35814  ORF Transcript_22994/g.35814 Transcript_22994/m.35814 type:complete len:201 (-) Transcript_22994:48-650(-)
MKHSNCKKRGDTCRELMISTVQAFNVLSKLPGSLTNSVTIENFTLLDGSLIVKQLLGLAYLDFPVVKSLVDMLCNTEIVRRFEGTEVLVESEEVHPLVTTFVHSRSWNQSEANVGRMLANCHHFTVNDLTAIQKAFEENYQISLLAKTTFLSSWKCPGIFLKSFRDDDSYELSNFFHLVVRLLLLRGEKKSKFITLLEGE